METENHECYVSLEVAKLLKEAGFDWEVDACYTYGDYFDFLQRPKNCNEIEHWHSAPTLSIAQKWLREVKNFDVYVIPTNGLYFVHTRKYLEPVETKLEYSEYPNQFVCRTYESALEAGINKCLTLLLKEE